MRCRFLALIAVLSCGHGNWSQADEETPRFSKSLFDQNGKPIGLPATEVDTTVKPTDLQQGLAPAAPAKLSPTDRKAIAVRANVERKVAPRFKRANLTKRSVAERPHVDDFFVVALFHMPLATREAELRFSVSQGVDQSTDNVADYILETPNGTVRDFQVVSRFKSGTDAEAGLQFTRKQYDAYREYQAQMLAQMKEMACQERAALLTIVTLAAVRSQPQPHCRMLATFCVSLRQPV